MLKNLHTKTVFWSIKQQEIWHQNKLRAFLSLNLQLSCQVWQLCLELYIIHWQKFLSLCDFYHHYFDIQSFWWRILETSAQSVMVQIVTGRFHQDWGEETGRCYEGWRELRQPLLSEPLQGCLPTGSDRYGRINKQTDVGSLYEQVTPRCPKFCSWEICLNVDLSLQTWWWACQSLRICTPSSARRRSTKRKRKRVRGEPRSRSACCCKPTCSCCCRTMRSFTEAGPSSIGTWGL